MLLVLTTIYEIYILVTNNKGIYHSIAVCKLTTETSCMCKKCSAVSDTNIIKYTLICWSTLSLSFSPQY